jgi:hypothetical protein
LAQIPPVIENPVSRENNRWAQDATEFDELLHKICVEVSTEKALAKLDVDGCVLERTQNQITFFLSHGNHK